MIDVVEKAFDVRMTLLQATEAMMHSAVKIKPDGDQEGSRPKNAVPTTKKEKQMKKINV